MPRITTKGQITIPKNIRDQFNVKTHDIKEVYSFDKDFDKLEDIKRIEP